MSNVLNAVTSVTASAGTSSELIIFSRKHWLPVDYEGHREYFIAVRKYSDFLD